MPNKKEIPASQDGLANLRHLLSGYETMEADILGLQSVLEGALVKRQRHLRRVLLLLYAALFATISGIVLEAMGPGEIGDFVLFAATLPQVLVLVLVILGLILKGMTLGRVIGISMGLLRSYGEELYEEYLEMLSEVIQDVGEEKAQRELIAFLRDRRSGAGGTIHPRWSDVQLAEREFRLLGNEIKATKIAVDQKRKELDLAVGAYGFAAICAGAGVVNALHPEHSSSVVALSAVSSVCAAACYLVFRKPGSAHYYLEEVLKKLGFSSRAVAETLRSTSSGLPSEHETEKLLERVEESS